MAWELVKITKWLSRDLTPRLTIHTYYHCECGVGGGDMFFKNELSVEK